MWFRNGSIRVEEGGRGVSVFSTPPSIGLTLGFTGHALSAVRIKGGAWFSIKIKITKVAADSELVLLE
jgi:hypothetical protein